MNQVILYGTPSSPYEIIKNSLKHAINKANLKIELKEIQDISVFIDNKLEKIPAVEYQNEIKNLKSKDVNSFVHELNQWILLNENYGDMIKLNVPIDYSDTSVNALAFAKSYSKDINGAIKMIHVFHPMINSIDFPDLSYDDIITEEKITFDNHVSEINKIWIGETNDDMPIVGEFKVGLAGDVLKEIANSTENDLMVIGTKKENTNQKKWLGSVSTDIIKTSEKALLIIPPKASYKGFKNILVCTNNTDLDIKVSTQIHALTKSNNPQIHLVHFGDSTEYDPTPLLNQWRNLQESDSIHFHQVHHSPDHNTLNNYCQQNKIDLVVAAKEKKSFLQDLFQSSFTKELVINTSIPFLVVK